MKSQEKSLSDAMKWFDKMLDQSQTFPGRFRVVNTDTKEVFYPEDGEMKITWPSGDKVDLYLNPGGQLITVEYHYPDTFIEIAPEFLKHQWLLGIYDTNGVEIGEGSIIQYRYTIAGHGLYTSVVCYNPRSCGWEIDTLAKPYQIARRFAYSIQAKKVEIIGNTLLNPELLEGVVGG